MNLSKKKRRGSNVTDVHHILWQARHWKSGWSKALRTHYYLRVRIPRDTLHRRIHEFVGDIPCPSGRCCKIAFLAIEEALDNGEISFDDRIEDRISFLIGVWKEECPDTVRALSRQRDIISNFYNGRR